MDDLAGGEAHAATLLYVFQNAHGKEPFAFFAFRYATEILVEELLYRRYFLKLFVVLRHQALFVAVEPVAFAAIEGVHGLGVELFVMDGATHVDRCGYFDADETTAARCVGEQVFMVAGADERGVTAQFLHGTGVRKTGVDHGLLEDMFHARYQTICIETIVTFAIIAMYMPTLQLGQTIN